MILHLKKNTDKICMIIRKCVVVIFVLIVITGIGAIIWFSLVDRKTDLGILDSYMRFDGNWGTGRGNIWSYLMDIYINEYNIFNKVFGDGQASVVMNLFQYYRDEMLYEWGYYVEDAHNVYLHYLMTTGVFGVLAYLGIVVNCLKHAFMKNADVWKKIVGIALLACASADIISILQPITAPFLWFYFGYIQHVDE